MRNIKAYREHIVQIQESGQKEPLPFSTRQYLERKVIPRIIMHSDGILDIIPKGWRSIDPITGKPIRLRNPSIGLIECIPMYTGMDVITVKLTPETYNDPVEYFTRDGGFSEHLTFKPEEDIEMLSRLCVQFMASVARRLRSRVALGSF